MDRPKVNALAKRLEKEFGVVLELTFRPGTEYSPAAIKIESIVVPSSERGAGRGSRTLQALVDFADQEKLLLLLTPSTDFGASSVARLRRFYGGFGFKRNLGRAKDYRFSETMIRQPRG